MRRLFIIFMIVAGLVNFTEAQDKRFAESPKTVLSEKVIVTTDRDFYLTGEKIWFSAHVFVDGKPASEDFSQVLYVELISFNQSQDVITKHQVIDGRVHGVLDLPEGLPTGYYLVRAYTTYQRRFGPEGFGSTVVRILNPAVPLVEETSKETKQIKGVVLEGDESERVMTVGLLFPRDLIRTKPRVTAVTEGDSLKRPVRYFQNGIGYFETDQPALKWKLQVVGNGDSTVVEVDIKKQGFILDIEQKGSALEVKGIKTDASASAASIIVYDKSGNFLSTHALRQSDQGFDAILGASFFSPGLFYLEVWNAQEESVATASVFYENRLKPETQIRINNSEFETRSRITFEVVMDDQETNILDYSIAVSKSEQKDNSIFPVVLVHNPGLITCEEAVRFAAQKNLAKQMAIALAFSSQWNFPVVRDTEGTSKDLHFAETRGVKISGLVRARGTKNDVADADVMLAILGDQPQLQVFNTNSEGRFVFALDHVKDDVNLYLVVKSDSTDLELVIDRDHNADFPELNYVTFLPDTSEKRFIDESFLNAQVTDNYIEEITIETQHSNAIRFQPPDAMIRFDDYVEMKTLEAALNEIVPYVRVRRKDGKAYLEVLDGLTNISYPDPLILLDDLPIFDVDELLEIHPNKIRSVYVINSTYLYGDNIFKGIVMIETQTENFGGYKLPGSFTSIEYSTTVSQANFNPVSHGQNDEKRIPDFRNLLFWEPQVVADENVKKFEFYTSDHVGTYQIKVRFLMKDGSFCTQTKEIVVK